MDQGKILSIVRECADLKQLEWPFLSLQGSNKSNIKGKSFFPRSYYSIWSSYLPWNVSTQIAVINIRLEHLRLGFCIINFRVHAKR